MWKGATMARSMTSMADRSDLVPPNFPISQGLPLDLYLLPRSRIDLTSLPLPCRRWTSRTRSRYLESGTPGGVSRVLNGWPSRQLCGGSSCVASQCCQGEVDTNRGHPPSITWWLIARDWMDEDGVKGRCIAGAINNYTSHLLTYGRSSPDYNLTQALLFHSNFIGDIHLTSLHCLGLCICCSSSCPTLSNVSRIAAGWKIEELKKKSEEAEDRLVRTQTELEEYKKLTEQNKEIEENKSLLRQLLRIHGTNPSSST